MTLRAVRSDCNHSLWHAFLDAFLDELGDRTGPAGYPSFAWLTHRVQRDALYRAAAERGLKGWLAPPVAFFSDLPRLFDLRERPLGLLERQVLIDELAARHGDGLGVDASSRFDRRGVGRAHDALIGELLPEDVTPDALEQALGALEGDAFARRRNAWVAAVYREYLGQLARAGRYDPRAIHAIVARRIEQGGLPAALGGAARLHVYGPTTLRARRRLLAALATQRDVEVVLYLPVCADTSEWNTVVPDAEVLDEDCREPLRVQPAPDERRELDWVALEIKRLVTERCVPPERIAVVARTGREDARAAHETLLAAGLPATARIRSPLAQVPALKAVLLLCRAAAADWTYRALRHVLASPYFDLDVDLRSVDRIACDRRVTTLERWASELARLRERAASVENGRELRDAGIVPDRLERDAAELARLAERAARLAAPRPVAEWLGVTRELLAPGWFGFRARLCEVPEGRWALVRLDQQAVDAADAMLRDWAAAEPGGEPVTVRDWTGRLQRFLAGNEIALSTPLRTGVQILEAHEAAQFPFEHTFVVHANDGEFPKRPGARWLFTGEELTALAAAGLPLADRAELLRRERVLWHAVTAGPQVTVTYRTADPAGIPLLPSLMVPRHDPSSEIPRTRFVWAEPFNREHADRTAMQRLAQAKRAGAAGAVRVVSPERISHGVLAACAERARAGAPPSPWNGELRDPRVLAHLAERFGPTRVWSPSQLERYSQNPFLFFVERVLHLDELAEAEEETTPLTFGGVAHRLLERFYAAFTGPFPTEFAGAAETEYARVADTALAELEADRSAWLGLPVLWAVTRRQIREAVAGFLGWELPRLKGRRPELLEHAFGEGGEQVWIEGADLNGDAARLLLRGRIDRIDRIVASGAGHVIDYKSGQTPSPQGYQDGGALQGPLYMAALRAQQKLSPASAVYLSIRHQKTAAAVDWGDADCRRALRIALSIPARVRAGLFEAMAAKSSKWPDYWIGLDVARVTPVYADGSRWDG